MWPIAFTILTGARDGATASFKIKHVDLTEGLVRQDAREVRTKFSKTFTTWYFPVGEENSRIVDDWVTHLQKDRLWGQNDPLFPATEITLGQGQRFEASVLRRAHWTTASPIRRIFKEAFEAAGLPYFNPHSFRKTLARFGEQVCQTPEEFKAWSQNLGHESVLTTLSSYGSVPPHRQREVLRELERPKEKAVAPDILIKQIAALVGNARH